MIPAGIIALAVLYACGSVTGSLLVDSRESLAWAVIRIVTGFLLTSIGFLLSLVAGIPWFIGPGALVAAALVRGRWTALRLPRPALRVSVSGVATAALATILVAPIVLSAARMAPGRFAPVFFSVDNAYFMEQVQSLAKTRTYPPPSLSNLGGRRTYHYAAHGAAAFLSKTTGLPPHTALYGFLVPLLVAGVIAAAVAAADSLAPNVPSFVAVPLLLITVPTFWYPFWGDFVALFGETSARNALQMIVFERYEVWGVATIEAHNLGAHFVVLAALAGIATAATRGWRLPVFLIGTAIIVKTPAGVALMAGFCVAQAYEAFLGRRLHPLGPAAAAAAVFAATYAVFWIAPSLPPDFAIELAPLFHINRMHERGALPGLVIDMLWLLLPVAIVASGRATGGRSTLPILLLAVAPFIVVNVTQAVDQRPGGGGATDDWLQILSLVTVILHAFVLAFADARWPQLRRGARYAFVSVAALAVIMVVIVAGGYARVLIQEPARGHEFADNRSIGEALAAVPIEGTVLVTNDLRYPADNFNRDNRQMQIPALWGHQAFAVNYRYEGFDFSPARLELQGLLASNAWTDAIEGAARAHGWTHLLIHKPYVHPQDIPLAKMFENDRYAVYRFGSLSPSPGTP